MLLQINARIVHQARSGTAHGGQLLGGRHAVGGDIHDTGADLLFQAGHAHHEELIQIGADNREEFDAFQQRVLRIFGFFQHAAEEFQLAQLTVDEQLGIVQSRIEFEVFQVIFLLNHGCPRLTA